MKSQKVLTSTLEIGIECYTFHKAREEKKSHGTTLNVFMSTITAVFYFTIDVLVWNALIIAEISFDDTILLYMKLDLHLYNTMSYSLVANHGQKTHLKRKKITKERALRMGQIQRTTFLKGDTLPTIWYSSINYGNDD